MGDKPNYRRPDLKVHSLVYTIPAFALEIEQDGLFLW
jgi:hypothetical protein